MKHANMRAGSFIKTLQTETVQSGRTGGILPLWVSAVAAGFMFFEWLAKSSSVCSCPLWFPK